jgi:hypothetical protein
MYSLRHGTDSLDENNFLNVILSMWEAGRQAVTLSPP